MSVAALFACSRCFSRHSFEDLSVGSQLCKNCHELASVLKCGYCRDEFLPLSKTHVICKKCEYYLNKYGKPGACEYCKIVAAFGGSKCLRCTNLESKYGPPIPCDECKLKSAFNTGEESQKTNGKLLCWLCSCAYKRALAKAQQDGRLLSKKRSHEKIRDYASSAASPDVKRPKLSKTSSSLQNSQFNSTPVSSGVQLPDIMTRNASGSSTSSGNGNLTMGSSVITPPPLISADGNSSDHVATLTKLREQISTLERRIVLKDKELFDKEKMLTEIKSLNYEKEIELRNKLKENDRLHEMKVENLNRKVASLLREIAGLKKSNKRNGTTCSRDRRENHYFEEEVSLSSATVEAVANTTETQTKNNRKRMAEDNDKKNSSKMVPTGANNSVQKDSDSSRSVTITNNSSSPSTSMSESHSRSSSIHSNSRSPNQSATVQSNAD